MTKLVNSPQNLGTTPPLEYIEATLRAGYEAIGIRLYRAPGRTYNFNPIVGVPDLMRDVKHALADSGLDCGRQNVGICLDPRQTFRDEHGIQVMHGQDPALFPYAQINDSSAVLGNAGTLPGEGMVPLFEYLAALPPDIPLSVEAQIPKGDVYTGHEWARISVERIRRFLESFAASRSV
jgi:hypothetical protein